MLLQAADEGRSAGGDHGQQDGKPEQENASSELITSDLEDT
jgi:hypothetical protein